MKIINDDIFASEEFNDLMEKHIEEILFFLIKNHSGFFVIINLKDLNTFPPLPKRILETFSDDSIFLGILNYALETAKIKDKKLVFNTSFGRENFETKVSIPFLGIEAIFSEEKVPIFVNAAISLEEEDEEIPTFLKIERD